MLFPEAELIFFHTFQLRVLFCVPSLAELRMTANYSNSRGVSRSAAICERVRARDERGEGHEVTRARAYIRTHLCVCVVCVRLLTPDIQLAERGLTSFARAVALVLWPCLKERFDDASTTSYTQKKDWLDN